MSNTNEKKTAEILGKVLKIVVVVVGSIWGKKKIDNWNSSKQQKA